MNTSRKIPTVCLLASTFAMGGAERVALSLALGLGRRGVRPFVISLREPGPIGKEMLDGGVPFESNIAGSGRDPRILGKLAGRLRKESADLLFCLDHHNAMFWGAVASKVAGVERRVLSVHSTGLWGRRSSFSLSDRFVMPFYDRVVALAETHADYLENNEGIPRNRITVIHNGIDITRHRPAASREERLRLRNTIGISASAFVVTIVAALRPEKNHEMLLRAAAELSCEGDYLFLIVGEGKEGATLRALAEQLSLGGTVRFTGNRGDIPEILAASDLFVLSSHPVVETFPLSILEAMAAGLPIVSTRVGSVEAILASGQEGILIEPGDLEALTRSIRMLRADESKRTAIGENARRRVASQFSLDKMMDEYIALFQELLSS
jgi:glycosyltransferase involved in cell wall biosynthesis